MFLASSDFDPSPRFHPDAKADSVAHGRGHYIGVTCHYVRGAREAHLRVEAPEQGHPQELLHIDVARYVQLGAQPERHLERPIADLVEAGQQFEWESAVPQARSEIRAQETALPAHAELARAIVAAAQRCAQENILSGQVRLLPLTGFAALRGPDADIATGTAAESCPPGETR